MRQGVSVDALMIFAARDAAADVPIVAFIIVFALPNAIDAAGMLLIAALALFGIHHTIAAETLDTSFIAADHPLAARLALVPAITTEIAGETCVTDPLPSIAQTADRPER